MAKFLKSIFSTEKRKTSRIENESEEERNDFTPPLDGRRKLSISRSGRMKQAYKKRLELSMELYGEEQQHEKPKNMEYHVNKTIEANPRRRSLECSPSRTEKKTPDDNRRNSVEAKTPEEEIESAFEIIDKVS